ncbi:MAG TPA: ABC transporter substrate-binding protein [Caulobacteraceae bacterium]|nr:ABC transporter substrate-binding protein [Caulobacteraceae bacterium]
MKGLRWLALAALVLVAGCSQSSAPAASNGLTPIRFATDWVPEAEQGGFFQALATGEYKKRGLDVKITEGGPAVNVPLLLATGAIDMGVGSNSFIAINQVQQNTGVVAIMASMQSDPQVLIAHAGQGINSIADMKGRPILLSDASVTAFWLWLKAKYGFTDAQVRSYNHSQQTFLANPSVIEEGYLTSEPYEIQKATGQPPAVFLLADEGYPGYAAMVLTSSKLIAANPKAVKAFVDATAAGWKSYLYGDPRPADAIILKDNPEMTPDLLAYARQKMRDKGIIAGGDAAAQGIGAMTDARWATFYGTISKQDPKDYPPALDYKKAYTLQFLPTGVK